MLSMEGDGVEASLVIGALDSSDVEDVLEPEQPARPNVATAAMASAVRVERLVIRMGVLLRRMNKTGR
jgi:ribosomal protein L12E/L44/L45/RPP1/RPP2